MWFCGLQWCAVCCSAVQCVAVLCSVLQCVAMRCSVIQSVAVCCSVLQCVAVLQRATECCSVLQCAAVCCSVLECAVAFCIALQCAALCWHNSQEIWSSVTRFIHMCHALMSCHMTLKKTNIRCWWCVAVCCSVLQCVAMHCNVLQWVNIIFEDADHPWHDSSMSSGEVGGWGRVPFSRNLMSPTPRRKWYLTTGRRAH